MNRLAGGLFLAFPSLCNRCSLHTSGVRLSSVFMKKQKKMDPEVAKLRETRKRRKLEREIAILKQRDKDPRPVAELSVLAEDPGLSGSIEKRRRQSLLLSEAEEDEMAVTLKDYARYQNRLRIAEMKWIRAAVARQENALRVLKAMSPQLYKQAIRPDPDSTLPLRFEGPALTPPIADYQEQSPDGEYIDTTKKYGGV